MPAKTRPPAVKQSQPPVCPRDGEVMTLVRVTPKLGALPELRTYRCARCGAVETVEAGRPVAAAM